MTYDHALTGLAASTVLGVALALIILLASAYVAVCRALDTRTDRRARRAARTHHARRATAHDDTVAVALGDACCETWWTSCGTEHDPNCSHQTRKEAR